MNIKITKIIYAVGLIIFLSIGIVKSVQAAVQNNSLSIEMLSSKTLNGTAGDYVTAQAQIKNTGQQSVSNITTYLSLVDEESKLPVDLEDWSAEKGLFIGTIESGQVLPLNLKVHFVKPGNYSLIIVAEIAGQDSPQTSVIIHFHVNQKHNLNPGQVLPVALGMPIILLAVIFAIQYRRNKNVEN
jgi:hypothetical protein